MKKIVLLIAFQAMLIVGNTQQNKLRVIPFYENDSADIYGVLHLLGIDIIKYKLSKEFYNHKVNLIIDEYTKGKKKEVYKTSNLMSKSIVDWSLSLNDSNKKEDFEIRFYVRKTDTILKQYSSVIRMGFENYLYLKRGKSYSYKDVYNLDSTNYKIVLGEKFPVWTYTQPVSKKAQLRKYDNDDNIAEFCGIGGERIPFTDWYKTLGIEHFFIFSIIVEKTTVKGEG